MKNKMSKKLKLKDKGLIEMWQTGKILAVLSAIYQSRR